MMACSRLLADCGTSIQPINDPTVPRGPELRTRPWLMGDPAEALVDVRDEPKRQRQPRFLPGNASCAASPGCCAGPGSNCRSW